MIRQIVLDTETTGLRPEEGHRIIEIGAIEIIDRRLTHNNRHFYINPERAIDEGAFKIHGISTQFLNDKPIFAEIADDFFNYFQGAELIIHNAPFDLNFLDHEFRWLNKNHPKIESICAIIDTLTMARKRHIGQRNSLDALCKRYEISNAHRQLHGALLDAQLLAEVFLRMTGGQNSLFDLNTIHTTAASLQTSIKIEVPKKHESLTVIHANDEEQILHEKYLANLEKKGACIWKKSTQEDFS